MIQKQDYQSSPGHTLTTWIDKIGKYLFYIGFALLLLHFLVLMTALRDLYSPHPLFWIEQKWAVYPFTSIIWIRVFSIIITHKMDCRYQALYLIVFLFSVLSLSYPPFTLTLLSVFLYPSLLVLGVHLPSNQQEDLPTTPTVQMESPPSFHQEPAIPSRENALQSFNQTERTIRPFPVRPSQRVGIWYCPSDKRHAGQLLTHLSPKIREKKIDLWDVSTITPGALWQEERKQAVASAAVAIILLSADFLACEHARWELPQLLRRAEEYGTIILRLHISPCAFEGRGLEKYQPLNTPEKPFAELSRTDRDRILVKAVCIIRKHLTASA